MSAVVRMARAFTGTDPASRVKRFEATKAANDSDVERLEAELEEAGVEFSETADPAKVGRIEVELGAAQSLRKRIADGLEKAQADLKAEQEAEAERLRQERYERMRKEATAFKSSIREDFVTVGEKIASFESLVDELPPNERYQFWIPTLAEEATTELMKDVKLGRNDLAGAAHRAMVTRQINVQLVVPITKVD